MNAPRLEQVEIHPLLYVNTVEGVSERRRSFDLLYADLRRQCEGLPVELDVYYDTALQGSLGPWLTILKNATVRQGITHVVYIPDDAELCANFVETLLAVIRAKPKEIICCQSNHDRSPGAFENGARWYTTHDGFTAFAGVIPIEDARAHLAWRAEALVDQDLIAGDLGVNTWCMLTKRLIHKPLPSLVNHNTDLKSLDGNDGDSPNNKSARRSLVWDPGVDLREVDWKDGEVTHLGLTYQGNHWCIFDRVNVDSWDVEAVYLTARQGMPVSETPQVHIATPAYAGIDIGYLSSRDATVRDLIEHGYKVSIDTTPGDSLVTRGRHTLVHRFLASPATHLLFWDSDIEVMFADTARMMLESGHDVVGGAYPFRDQSGGVVCNLLQETRESRRLVVDERGCTPVSEIGTGFLMISRKAILEVIDAHPELFYYTDTVGDIGTPRWAIFDVQIRDRRYLSEDWLFCQHWRALGHQVYAFVLGEFQHWGLQPSRGAFMKAFGFNRKEAPLPQGEPDV